MIYLALQFHKQKSKNRYLWLALHICCWYIYSYWYTYNCYSRITISISEKTKTSISAVFYSTSVSKPTAACTIPFLLLTSIFVAVALALWFLQSKKQKQIPATGLIYLLPLHYNFYNWKSKDRYMQLAWHTCSCCLYIYNQKSKSS